jgi:hypothetical protein
MSLLEDDVVLRRVSFVKIVVAVAFGVVAGVLHLSGVQVIAYFLALANAAAFYYVSKVSSEIFFFSSSSSFLSKKGLEA